MSQLSKIETTSSSMTHVRHTQSYCFDGFPATSLWRCGGGLQKIKFTAKATNIMFTAKNKFTLTDNEISAGPFT